MALKKRILTDNINNNLAIKKLADQLADRPYGQEPAEDNIMRTTISLPASVLFKLEDMAKGNKRKQGSLKSVSAIIRDCISKCLNL